MISTRIGAAATALALALSFQTSSALADNANHPTAQYHEGEETTVYCGVGLMCEITLEPGEHVRKRVVSSQSAIWDTQFLESGENPPTPHIYFKPRYEDLRQNAFVSTNKREYRLMLVSTKSKRATLMSFLYTDEQRARDRHARRIREIAETYRNSRYHASRRFAFAPISILDQACTSRPQAQWRMDRTPAEFMPRKVCQSTDHTYVAMPMGPMQTNDLPVVNLDTSDGDRAVNGHYDPHNRVFIIDGVAPNYVLKSSSGRKQVRLRIQRNDPPAPSQAHHNRRHHHHE